MLGKRKTGSLDYLEIFLILIFIILVCGIFNFISRYFRINIFLYNAIVLLLTVLTIFVAAIAIFQFVKIKYLEVAKQEVNIEMDNYKAKISNKIIETNTRIGYFEVEYSKKLKKVMKDYIIKAKEIEDIKKELAEKMILIDRKTAELEIETCLLKAEKLDLKYRRLIYERIIQLNDIYPGICNEQILKEIYLIVKNKD